MCAAPTQLIIDSEGYYFLDRDPTYVHYVLEFLRNGGRLPANMPPPSDPEYARIREEFDYFLLADVAFQKSLVEHIREDAFEVETLVSAAAPESNQVCNPLLTHHCEINAAVPLPTSPCTLR